MSDKEFPSGKQYVYAFTSRKLVVLVSMVLVLMALSMMLGIRLERFQRTSEPENAAIVLEEAAPAPSAVPGASDAVEAQNMAADAPDTAEIAPADLPESSRKEENALPQAAPAPVIQPAQPAKEKKPQEVVARKPVAALQPASQKAIVQPAPLPPQKIAQAPPAGKSNFVIQISASQDQTLAANQMAELKSKGFDPYVQESTVEGKGKFYRLLIGPFKTEADATVVLNNLKKDASYARSYIRSLP